MHTARLSSNTGTPSRLSEKLANRNGPRHSVYWVQTKKASDMRLPTHSNVLDATNMGDASAKVEYTLVGKYTGDWKDGVKHGYGVLIYANGNKYEGEWVEGKREGKGVYWIHDKKHKKLRKQFAGDWQRDQRHGLGTFFHEDGSRYEGFWANNKREGDGRMLYGSDRSVYEGQWSGNVRSGRGTLTLVNGDIYDGYWLNDKKEGPGRFYYKATRKMYEGEWVDGAPKCGTYHDNYDHDDDDARHAFGDDDGDGSSALRRHHRFELPELELAHPEQVVSESIAKIRQERVLEKAFDARNGNEFDEDGDDDESGGNDPESPSHEAHAVVFDERTMRVIQSQFHAIEQSASENDDCHRKKDGCIHCAALPRLIGSVGLSIDEHELRSFLDELGASPDTLVSFAECVDILSLLAESEMGDRRSRSDHDESEEEYDEDDA